MQLAMEDSVQQEVTALEKRLMELEARRPDMEAQNLRLHSALLRQAQFLPTTDKVRAPKWLVEVHPQPC